MDKDLAKRVQAELAKVEGIKPPNKVLVVDDNTLAADLMAQTIREIGLEVSVAKDGREALDLVAMEHPDLILLDIMMPGMDGYQVCAKLREDERTRRIPVVMVTSLSELEERVKGIEVGADDFLTKPFNDTILCARVRALLRTKYLNDQLENAEVVIESLALSIEAKDPYTEGHCQRIFRFTTTLGKHLGMSDEQVRALQRGGFLHDIGKIGIPDTVLLKRGPLSEEEWEVMRRHPVIGEKICEPLHSLKLTLPIIRHHHEKWNGTGYPDHLKGNKIPITARILQVCDIFDALVTDRPYRAALSHKKAFEILRSEVVKGWWDKEVVEEWIGLVQSGKAKVIEK